MKFIFTILILTISLLRCKPSQNVIEKELNVVFIGNSLTYFPEMYLLVQAMVDEIHPNIKIHQSTFPSMSLTGHINSIIVSKSENGISGRQKTENEIIKTEKKIKARRWDIVILQNGEVSVLNPNSRKYVLGKAIVDIKVLVDNRGCHFMLFSTWISLRDYPKKYSYSSRDITYLEEDRCSPTINNPKEEITLLNEAYTELTRRNKLTKPSHGDKFYEIRTQHPNVNLYEDDYHPNENGSFLNACIFYELLTNSKAPSLKYVGNIEPEIARLLKKSHINIHYEQNSTNNRSNERNW